MPAAALMLIPAALQAGMGVAQYLGGRKLANQATPDYNIPKEYQDMLNVQGAYANADMPGSGQVRQDIRGNTSDYLGMAERFGQIDPNTANAAYTQEQEALADFGVQNAMYRVGEKDKLLNAKGIMADQKLNKQQWEVLTPFERTMQSGSALMGAGIQNTFGALGSAADMIGYSAMNGTDLFGGNKSAINNGIVTDPAIRSMYQNDPLMQVGQKQAYSNFMGANPSLFVSPNQTQAPMSQNAPLGTGYVQTPSYSGAPIMKSFWDNAFKNSMGFSYGNMMLPQNY